MARPEDPVLLYLENNAARASALRRRLALLAHYIDEPEALDLALEMRQIADELRDETIPWYTRRKQWTAPEEDR